MSTLKQLIECEISDFFAGFGHPGEPETPEEMQSQLLARVMPLLAGLEQEPVGYFYEDGPKNWYQIMDGDSVPPNMRRPLYAAPQLPQSAVPECFARFHEIIRNRHHGRMPEEVQSAFDECAAMLQGDEPVTTAYKLPASAPCKDAPEHIWLQTAGVWPENGEFSELTWCSDNQHEDDTLYVRADIVAGNSPVIHDGWVAVPVEPTEEILDEFDSIIDYGAEDSKDAWSRLLAAAWIKSLPAAPQQEVK